MARRDAIRMSDAEIATLLTGRHTMSVATLEADGRPHLVAMWYALVGAAGWPDADVAFWTYARSQKVVNLRRDPRITCLVETGDAYDELRGVQITGRAEISDDPEAVVTVGAGVYRRYQGGEIDEEVRRGLARMGAKRVAVRVVPDAVVSWDHRKL